MSETDRVVVTTVVEVDPSTAFRVFTEETDLWWRQGPRFRVHPERAGRICFEGRVGGRLLEAYDEMGRDAFEHGRVLVWDPPKRLVFEMSGRNHAPDEHTEVEVRFEGRPPGTRVTVEHRGWDRFGPDHPVRHGLAGGAFTNMMGSWWGDLLVELRAHSASRSSRRAGG